MVENFPKSNSKASAPLRQQPVARGISELEQMINRITASYRITRSDQQKLMDVLLAQQTIGSNEQRLVDRVFDLLRAGRLRVVD